MGYEGVVVYSFVTTTNAATFTEVMINHVLPLLPPNTMLIMDNLSVHHSRAVLEAVKPIFAQQAVGLGFLPVYSPDLNPIECLFGQVKAYIKEEGLFDEDPLGAIVRGFGLITAYQCQQWYHHCGYN